MVGQEAPERRPDKLTARTAIRSVATTSLFAQAARAAIAESAVDVLCGIISAGRLWRSEVRF